MLQNDNLTGRVNELVQEQEGTQLYIRDMMLERNAAVKDFNSEQEQRGVLTEKLKQCNYLKDLTTQDYAAEHFKNAGLQDDLNRMRDQHPIEIAALRDAATIERAAQLSVLRQEAAMALTLAQGEGLGSQTGHRGTKAARLSRLPRPPGWQQP